MNKPKNIGTATETAVVRYLRDNGFPNAERRALAGIHDLGDIVGTPGIVWEVKGGKAAETASDAQIDAWLVETETERRNCNPGGFEVSGPVGVLVTKRKAVGVTRVGEWWAWLWLDPLDQQRGFRGFDGSRARFGFGDRTDRVVPVRMRLCDAVKVLRVWGYGDELPEDAA